MYSRTTVAIIAAIAFGLGALVGVLGWNRITAGSGEASISASDAAATIAAQQSLTNPTTAATTVATSGATVAAATQRPTQTSAAASTVEAVTTAETEAVPVVASTGGTTYRIDSEQSEVRFTLQEDLRGSRVDVIGTTKDVGGDIIIDFQQPQNSIIQPIVINARTLATDVSFRNEAIRSRILRSAEPAYEFITFVPTEITGLPTTPVTEGPITLKVTGDLQIVETTKSVTFDVVISSISDIQIAGAGITEINWADFNLSIPNAPGVANITPEVTLEIEFVAEAID